MEPIQLQPTTAGDSLLDRQTAIAQATANTQGTFADPQDTEWNEHEHTAGVVMVQAEHLLHRAGSPELAKHAIDVAARQHPESAGLDDLP